VLSIGDATVAERDVAGLTAALTVTLAPTTTQTVTVGYATAAGTATAPGDYTTSTGSLTFTSGQSSKTISVPITGDTAPEPNETFTVTLSAPTGATIGDGSGVVTIRDDDPAAVDFHADGTADVVVDRAGAWLFFDYATGTAMPGVWIGEPAAGCIPAPADYNGDGRQEFAQLCAGFWHFYSDAGAYLKGIWTGGVAGDLPVPADYDGDGKDDVVVFRGGAWLFYSYQTGLATGGVWTGDPPLWPGFTHSFPYPADFDGDGKADFSIYSGGPWHFFNPDGSYKKGIWTGGVVGDVAVGGDYDGDGVDDVVVWRAGAWLWYDYATGNYVPAKSVWTGAPAHFTGGTPLPAPVDVDGDGRLEYAVWSGGPWHFFTDNGTYDRGVWCGGVVGDLPVSRRPLP
jgi:hypothetical protein